MKPILKKNIIFGKANLKSLFGEFYQHGESKEKGKQNYFVKCEPVSLHPTRWYTGLNSLSMYCLSSL